MNSQDMQTCVICRKPLEPAAVDKTGLAHEVCAVRELALCGIVDGPPIAELPPYEGPEIPF